MSTEQKVYMNYQYVFTERKVYMNYLYVSTKRKVYMNYQYVSTECKVYMNLCMCPQRKISGKHNPQSMKNAWITCMI